MPETRTVFLEGLNQPFGMRVHGDFFYAANTDALWRHPYSPGATSITGKGETVLSCGL